MQTAPDFETIKTRQQATWASGDFGKVRRNTGGRQSLIVPGDYLEVVIRRA